MVTRCISPFEGFGLQASHIYYLRTGGLVCAMVPIGAANWSKKNRKSGSSGSMFGGIDGESLVQVYNESVDFMYKDQARCLAAFGGHFGYDDRRQRTIFSGTTRSGHTKPANPWIFNCP